MCTNTENEIQEYISYLENEIESIRNYIDEKYTPYNTGSISEDVIDLLEKLEKDMENT